MKQFLNISSLLFSLHAIMFMLCFTFLSFSADAQKYRVEDGKMVIEIPLDLNPFALDSFIHKFDLSDMGIKAMLTEGKMDSLKKMGWEISREAGKVLKITRSFESSPDLGNLEGKLLFASKEATDVLFPRIPEGLRGGANNFQQGKEFQVRDSIVHFFLPGHARAQRVFLSGSFVNWSENKLELTKEADGWGIDLPLRAGKYWYKFIVDGNWILDPSNKNRENDGEGNVNSVYFKTNYSFVLNGMEKARCAELAGSFNNWSTWLMKKTPEGWKLDVFLSEGSHTYRYVVDGNWMQDPANPNKLPNEFGEFNSLINIGSPTIFRLEGYQNASDVRLAGNFNHWREDELILTRKNGGWEIPYVLAAGNYWYRFIIDGKRIVDTTKRFASSPDANNNVNILIINPNHCFMLKGFPDAKTVALAGDFNDFNSTSFLMQREGDHWTTDVHLSVGKHIYKFVVDGKWILDPGNPQWEQNQYETGNSVIWIEP